MFHIGTRKVNVLVAPRVDVYFGWMLSHDINEEIIEDLYTEALILADDARAVFDLRTGEGGAESHDLTRVALSIEGLRTTTRVMHVLAWLLNQRAFLAGELTKAQLDRCGSLPPERGSEADNLALLEPETRNLIQESERLHERVARLNQRMQGDLDQQASVRSLHHRIEKAFASG